MYLKRNVGESLITFKTLHFRYKTSKKNSYKHSAIIGIGGNVGDVKRRFEHLFIFFKREKKVKLILTSLILKNPPFGYIEQDDFFNSIIVLKTDMAPKALLSYLLRVEKRFGRKRSFENAPRTLDLDIIFYDDIVVDKPNLQIPHPSWHQRESVLIPLMDIIR
ncbi:MAG: 2-amino-4-hydroxy-6-hydroxymethyldihydropteridine diphosphokinase [Campylobacterales bacterium]|nr:2-amino-4-hydroxy-6-hydroxymethyldihydropteridine diphosphokinase [Campylobacterales bacterium]